VVATVLGNHLAKLFAVVGGIVLILMIGMCREALFAQIQPSYLQDDFLEGEEFTPEERDSPYGREFQEEEPKEQLLTTEENEEEDDREHEAAPILPKNFSPQSVPYFSDRFPEEKIRTPPGGSLSDSALPEEPPLMSNASPTLPDASTLPPHEQLAIHFVEAGVEALSRDELELAQEQFEQAVEIAPLQPFSYYFLGRLAFARDDHKAALVFLRKADVLLIKGDQMWRGEAARLRGAVYEDTRDYLRARVAYRQSLQFAPTNLRAASALARLASEEPDFDARFPR
jgi:tetratricopeptide (TPR) repeat protein